MRLVRPLLSILLVGTPVGAAAPERVSAMSMDSEPSASTAAEAAQAAWMGTFYRCAGERSARRVIASVADRRPASAQAALPVLLESVGREDCVEVGDGYEWTGIPIEIEFEEDGQGLQLIMGKEPNGRPVALVYRRGAC